jgi:hypothetical protein
MIEAHWQTEEADGWPTRHHPRCQPAAVGQGAVVRLQQTTEADDSNEQNKRPVMVSKAGPQARAKNVLTAIVATNASAISVRGPDVEITSQPPQHPIRAKMDPTQFPAEHGRRSCCEYITERLIL